MEAKYTRAETFVNERSSDERESLTVCYNNWGEPYEEGVRFDMQCGSERVTVDLTEDETKRLHALLGRILDKKLR